MSKKPVLVIQPGYAGDILFVQKIAAVWAARGHRVIFPVEDRFAAVAAGLHPPAGVEMPLHSEPFDFRETYAVVMKSADEAASRGEVGYHIQPLELQDCICLPLASSWRIALLDTMAVKYQLSGIDASDWPDYVRLNRDPQREQRLLDTLGIHDGRDFVLVNEQGGSRKLDIQVHGDVVRMQVLDGFTLIDWAAVAERAREIITIDTSLVILVEALKLRCPLQMVSRYTPARFHVKPILTLPWRLANTVDDLAWPAITARTQSRGGAIETLDDATLAAASYPEMDADRAADLQQVCAQLNAAHPGFLWFVAPTPAKVRIEVVRAATSRAAGQG